MSSETTCFQFKASFSPCTILQLLRYDLDVLARQLTETVKSAPNFFAGAPVVIELEKIKSAGILNFEKIKQLLIEHNMVPVGTRGGSEEQIQAATAAGLPLVSLGSKQSTPTNTAAVQSNKHVSKTILINKPIRSGMQLYAKDGDLIVTGSVSPGAELMADDHIHVYGALRGRALAGVQGNMNARIFCQQLEAELVSIAGYYLTKDDMHHMAKHKGSIQIYLKDEQIQIESL